MRICTIHGFDRSQNYSGGSEIQLLQIQDELIRQDHELIHFHMNEDRYRKYPEFTKNGNLITYHLQTK